jgi:hypothetical protein
MGQHDAVVDQQWIPVFSAYEDLNITGRAKNCL